MKDNAVYWIFAHIPFLEVGFRISLSRLNKAKVVANRIYEKVKNKNDKRPIVDGQWTKFKDCIVNQCGIKKGDIVLVHSSIKGLGTMGVDADEILTFLEETIGEEGTLVFPTYPDLKKMKKIGEKYIYDPLSTQPWTGMLPRRFLMREGVVRSQFPHNTLAAKGKYAKAMMKDNLYNAKYSQGANSSWKFCIDHDVKILYLGVKACTSCTIVHFAEDIMGENWPIKAWHIPHKYLIQVDQKFIDFETRERDEKWFKYYKMFNTGIRLAKKGYLREYDIDGVYIGIMDNVKNMSDWIVSEANQGRLLFCIPQWYKKRKA